MRERDLFRAIVLSGSALVTPGCSSAPLATDAGSDAPTAADAPVAVADAGTDAPIAPAVDAPDPGDPDGFVAII